MLRMLKSKLVLDFTATLNIASPASSINFLKINHWSSPLILTRTGSDWFRKLTAPGVNYCIIHIIDKFLKNKILIITDDLDLTGSD